MQKLDRLGWAAGVCVEAYGVKLGVRVTRAEAMDQVIQRLPPCWKPLSSPLVDVVYSFVVAGESRPRQSRTRTYNVVYQGTTLRARTMDLEVALDLLEGEMQLVVGEWSRQGAFVHAGVVAWRGQAILLPAKSMSGKSTLVEALVKAGATYYSDEFAVLDEYGRVVPFPRRLSLRRRGDRPPCRCAAEDLGGRVGADPVPVGLVVFTRHREGACWRPQCVAPGKAALDMMGHSLSVLHEPEWTMNILGKVTRQARCLKSSRGDADETAPLLLQELDALATPEPRPRQSNATSTPRPAQRATTELSSS